jgi:hypothetical protein
MGRNELKCSSLILGFWVFIWLTEVDFIVETHELYKDSKKSNKSKLTNALEL